MNNSSKPCNCVEHTFSNAVVISVVIVTAVLAVVTTIWNCILIFIIARTPVLHTLTNALIVSLAIGELLAGVVVMPFSAATWFHESQPFSSTVCSFVGFMTSLHSSSISFGILTVSLDRCVAISRPLQYSRYINRNSVIAMISAVWSISLVFSLFPVFGRGSYGYSHYYRRCITQMFVQTSFSVVSFITCQVLPAFVIIITLIIIVSEARSHHRVIAIAQLAIAMYSGPAAAAGFNYSRSTFRAMRTFLVITIMYLVSYLPLALYSLIVIGNRSLQSNSTFIVLTLMSFVCCLATPLIITTFNSKFKLSIQMMFQRKTKVAPGHVDSDTFTISTGLHSVLDTSVGMKLKQTGSMICDTEQVPGTSSRGVRLFPQRRISVLPEVNSSSSSPTSGNETAVRKSSSFPT